MSFYPAEITGPFITPWEKAPLLRVVCCLMLGIGLAWLCRDLMNSTLWMIITLTLSVAIAIIRYTPWTKNKSKNTHRAQYLWKVGVLCVALTGSATIGQMHYESLQTDFPETPQYECGKVINRHKVYDNGVSLDVRLQGSKPTVGQTVRLRIEGEACKELQPGDRLTFKSRLSQPSEVGNPHDFDYKSYLLTHSIVGTGYVSAQNWSRLPASTSRTWQTRFLRLRQNLSKQYAHLLDERVYPLLSALTLGDKALLDSDTRDLFSETGTSHVLALSGLHLSILYSLIHLTFLRWFRRRIFFVIAHLLTLGVLWSFVFMAGAPLSLQRAAFMFSLWVGCSCIQRTHGTGLNNWAFAALVLLLISPLSLFDVSFQLSFAAVLSILLCNDYIWNRHPLPDWWDKDDLDKALFHTVDEENPISRSFRLRRRILQKLTPPCWKFIKHTLIPFFTVSLSAQLGTLPLILYYFHQFTPYTVLANVFVIPAIYILIGCALLFFLIPFTPFQTFLASILNFVSLNMVHGLEAMSLWPGTTLKCYPSPLTLCLLCVLPFLIFGLCTQHRIRMRKRLFYTITGCLVTMIGSEFWTWNHRRLTPQIIVYQASQATLIHFVVSNDETYLYSSVSADTTRWKTASIRQQFWEPYGLAEPQRIDSTLFKNAHLYHRKNYFLFGNETLLRLNHRVTPPDQPDPLHIQTLLIERGCYDSLAVVRQVFLPECIVLDRSLSSRLRRRWKKECEESGISCHDLRTDGAYRRNIKSS